MAKKKVTRISNITKPSGYSLEGWQVLLRKQAARKETFGIREIGPEGRYLVSNGVTQNQYIVDYYGEGHELNACSCMDYKTSRLGTCKHMEAVKSWIADKRSRRIYRPDSTRTILFMDYHDAPTVHIRYGREDRQEMKAVFGSLFDRDGVLTPLGKLRLYPAIFDARKGSPYFLCHDDVLEYATRIWDNQSRHERMDEIFKDSGWWKDIFVKGIVPYPYQREGMEFAARAGRCIIADEMGLGKTIQAIGTAALLQREGYVSSTLIVCPTSLKYQWKREIKTFTGADALVIEGGHLTRKKLYAAPDRFKIVSYNSLSNDIKILGGLDTDMIIMDEVQRLKNWGTQIAKAARKIHSDYAVILSGTPLENKLEELYSIVQLVDQYLLGPYYAFRAEHIITSPSGKVTGYKGLNAVGQQLSSILIRRRKADVALQLPERMDKNLFVPMTKEQMGIHEEYKETAARIIHKWQVMHYLSETDRKRLLMLLSMMRMVCDSTYILDQKSRYDTKVEETMNILETIFASGDEKVVIFSGWERMTRLIAQELDARGIGFSNLNGSVPSAKRKDLMDRFTDDPAVRVFLSTDAGATGLNLQAASYLINLDLPWNPAVLEQRIGRIYRIGQQRNIQVINLISIGTIEEQMLGKLRFKTGLFDGVLNGGEDNVFLDDNKLETMVKDLGFIQEEVPDDAAGGQALPQEPGVTDGSAGPDHSAGSETAVIAGDEVEQRAIGEADPMESDMAETSAEVTPGQSGAPAAEDLVAQGVSFLGNLLNTLKEPESARSLVDTLVREDPDTGQASIHIPVSGKETVLQFVTLLGKLLK